MIPRPTQLQTRDCALGGRGTLPSAPDLCRPEGQRSADPSRLHIVSHFELLPAQCQGQSPAFKVPVAVATCTSGASTDSKRQRQCWHQWQLPARAIWHAGADRVPGGGKGRRRRAGSRAAPVATPRPQARRPRGDRSESPSTRTAAFQRSCYATCWRRPPLEAKLFFLFFFCTRTLVLQARVCLSRGRFPARAGWLIYPRRLRRSPRRQPELTF